MYATKLCTMNFLMAIGSAAATAVMQHHLKGEICNVSVYYIGSCNDVTCPYFVTLAEVGTCTVESILVQSDRFSQVQSHIPVHVALDLNLATGAYAGGRLLLHICTSTDIREI